MTVSIPVGSSDLVWIDGNKDMMMTAPFESMLRHTTGCIL
jgi:hypothetical protein